MECSKVRLKLVKEDGFTYNARKVTSPKDIVEFINGIEQLDLEPNENIYLVCLDTKNNILNYMLLAKGGLSSTPLDLKSLFKTVLVSNASSFILVHNHPSGDSTPSSADISITKQIHKGAKLLDLVMLDHIIIGDSFTSIKAYSEVKGVGIW